MVPCPQRGQRRAAAGGAQRRGAEDPGFPHRWHMRKPCRLEVLL